MSKSLYRIALVIVLFCCGELSTQQAFSQKPSSPKPASGKTVRVVVWDEQQPRQEMAYDNFLGNEIAAYLKKRPGISVRSMKLDDAAQGLSEAMLDNCDVLIWWGHARHSEVKKEMGLKILSRIKQGRLSLIVLHSAHWSTPFIEAMYHRTRSDVQKQFSGVSKDKLTFLFSPPRKTYKAPNKKDLVTPTVRIRKFPQGITDILVELPNCCFPAYRADGKPSQIRTLLPNHPIAQGIPSHFALPQTEMYNEPFHVPQPDEVVFEERWKSGDWFRSGCVWNIGKGKVFYFRPGHETYPVYKNPVVLKILENASRWLAGQ